MTRRQRLAGFVILGACLLALMLLGGCTTDQAAIAPLPAVTVQGPTFTPSQFDCAARPLEPDLAKVPKEKQGSAALRYKNALGTWGQRCQNKLRAAGAALAAAGLVVAAGR